MAYKVQIKKQAIKYFKTLRKKDAQRIFTVIEGLATNPRPSGYKKLSGEEAYRIIIGSYRIIYEVEDDKLIVYVIKVGPRGDVYKKL